MSIIKAAKPKAPETTGGMANKVLCEIAKATIVTIPLAKIAYTLDKWFWVFGVLFVKGVILHIAHFKNGVKIKAAKRIHKWCWHFIIIIIIL